MFTPSSSLLMGLTLLVTFCQLGSAFIPDDNINMDFMNDTSAMDDIQKMMLINSDDPKMRAQAMEAFKEIMDAKRLSTLQECRRTCVNEFEDATEFQRCNEKCEATVKPGEYRELPNIGSMFKEKPADKKEPDAKEKAADQGKPDNPAGAAGPGEADKPAGAVGPGEPDKPAGAASPVKSDL